MEETLHLNGLCLQSFLYLLVRVCICVCVCVMSQPARWNVYSRNNVFMLFGIHCSGLFWHLSMTLTTHLHQWTKVHTIDQNSQLHWMKKNHNWKHRKSWKRPLMAPFCRWAHWGPQRYTAACHSAAKGRSLHCSFFLLLFMPVLCLSGCDLFQGGCLFLVDLTIALSLGDF